MAPWKVGQQRTRLQAVVAGEETLAIAGELRSDEGMHIGVMASEVAASLVKPVGPLEVSLESVLVEDTRDVELLEDPLKRGAWTEALFASIWTKTVLN